MLIIPSAVKSALSTPSPPPQFTLIATYRLPRDHLVRKWMLPEQNIHTITELALELTRFIAIRSKVFGVCSMEGAVPLHSITCFQNEVVDLFYMRCTLFFWEESLETHKD